MKNDYQFKMDSKLDIIQQLENSRTCDSMDIVMDYIEDGLPENAGFNALHVSDDSTAYKNLSLSVNENAVPTYQINIKNGKIEYLINKDKFTDSQKTAITILSKLQQQLY